jgi:diaminopropionate ammonia-lyase
MGIARVVRNPYVNRAAVPPPVFTSVGFHRSIPGFVPTPLRESETAARALNVRSVWVKDESTRLGMPAFKILGASWATYRALMKHLGRPEHDEPTLAALKQAVAESGRDLALVAATDGNHGRAVARMARMLGLRCTIFVPQGTVRSRIKAIARNGADVVVVDGNYDDAIAASAAMADDLHVVISDTSWEGYTECPRWVIDGYQTMLKEVIDLIDDGMVPEPSVVVAQMGVGAFSCAVASAFAHRKARLLVGAEPTVADCLTTSIERGGRIEIIADTPYTCMAGLNCGTPSVVAWETNKAAFGAFGAVEDADAEQATRVLHHDWIDAGESGAAGLACLLRWGKEIGLRADDDVLLFVTEGVTDPVNFARIIGPESDD